MATQNAIRNFRDNETTIIFQTVLLYTAFSFLLSWFSFWENREKSGMSIEVHQRDGKPEFWLQMRVVDQAQEDLFRRIEKAKRLNLELLPETDQNRSCRVILWTESRISHCPWCGRDLEHFYYSNWETLFAPVLEHEAVMHSALLAERENDF